MLFIKEIILSQLRIIQIGLIFPDHFRSLTNTKERKEKSFYAIRVLCYCMGVQDQFNLFSWPMEDIEKIARYDFWTNMYPIIVNHNNLSKIKANTINKELFDKRFTKLVYYVWENEIYNMVNISQADKSVLGYKKNVNGYLLFKNYLVLKIPNAVVISLIRFSVKQKRLIMNIIKIFQKIYI